MLPALTALRRAVAVVALTMAGNTAAADVTLETDIWPKVRATLFGDRPIADATPQMLTLRAPARAMDAAVVPIALTAGETSVGQIRTLYLVIDHNPSPIAAVFRFGEAAARAAIETRVRIETYSPVRAIAETADGRLFQVAQFIKAAGGCSAPATFRDEDVRLGRMRLSVEQTGADGSAAAQLAVFHPNHSGLAMDQLTRLYAPAWYVRTIRVTHRDQLVLEADVDFSLSENPNLRFWLRSRDGPLHAEAVDTRDLHFETSLDIR